MANRKNPKLADYGDDIIIENENYAHLGIHKDYIGVVLENFIEERNALLVDFYNTFGKDIAIQVEIKLGDYRVFTKTLKEDQVASKCFTEILKDLAKKTERKDVKLVEYGDSIIIQNENYAHLGIHKDYLGLVVESPNFDKQCVKVDFLNNINSDVKKIVQVKLGDFKIYEHFREEDRRTVKFFTAK